MIDLNASLHIRILNPTHNNNKLLTKLAVNSYSAMSH